MTQQQRQSKSSSRCKAFMALQDLTKENSTASKSEEHNSPEAAPTQIPVLETRRKWSSLRRAAELDHLSKHKQARAGHEETSSYEAKRLLKLNA